MLTNSLLMYIPYVQKSSWNPKRKLNQLQSLTGLEAEWRRFVAEQETNDTLL